MVGLLLTLMALALPPSIAHTSSSNPCSLHLAPSGLGIGALVTGQDGHLSLGLAPYVGSSHRNLVLVLDRAHHLKKIHWLGEARYKIDGNSLQISEANETSGLFKELSDSGAKWEEHPIELTNSVANLPPSVLTTPFNGIPFDPQNMRLAPELNGLKSVRHDIGNALQAVVAIAELMQRVDSDRQRATIATLLDQEVRRNLDLANWFVEHLVSTGRLEIAEIRHVHDILVLLTAKEWGTVSDGMDRQTLDHEMQIVAREANLSLDEMPVEIFEVTP